MNMQSQKDGEFRFIMNYQDHLTKMVTLRPLKTKTAEDYMHSKKKIQIWKIRIWTILGLWQVTPLYGISMLNYL